ncbi:YppE family protein [Bacillus sp. Bva_UNVM-123]|uniref:YppE family protein n=1 Tax=Bacillus sp. Bva_UNVM-123 TaxID=2829798 RepID=UPI00391F80C7
MKEKNELKKLTIQLLSLVNTVAEKFEDVKKTGKAGDFYTEVKPFADKVKHINDQWRIVALNWIETRKPKNMHVAQIDSTYDQIEAIAVQAFFPETSRTRFTNIVTSIKYILNNIIALVSKEEREP